MTSELRTRWTERQAGQVMAEYAIVLGLLTVGVVTVFTVVLPGAIQGALNSVIGLL